MRRSRAGGPCRRPGGTRHLPGAHSAAASPRRRPGAAGGGRRVTRLSAGSWAGGGAAGEGGRDGGSVKQQLGPLPLAPSLGPWPCCGRVGFRPSPSTGTSTVSTSAWHSPSRQDRRRLGGPGLTGGWATAPGAGGGPGGAGGSADRAWSELCHGDCCGSEWVTRRGESEHRAMEKQIRYCNAREHRANLEVTCGRAQHRAAALLGAVRRTEKD